MNVVCTNVRKVHSHFSLGEYETSPAHYSPVNSESVLPTEALIAESHREEFQVHSNPGITSVRLLAPVLASHAHIKCTRGSLSGFLIKIRKGMMA